MLLKKAKLELGRDQGKEWKDSILIETQYSMNLEHRFVRLLSYCCLPKKIQGPEYSVK